MEHRMRRRYQIPVWIICFILFMFSAGETQAKKCTDFEEFASAAGKLVRDRACVGSQRSASLGKWDSGRLIVQVKGRFDPSKYGPETVIEGPDKLFVLQFASSSKARSAYRKIVSGEKIVFAEPDFVHLAASVSQQASVNTLSYGASVTGLADYSMRLSVPSSRKVTVAVVDSGVNSHSFLAGRLKKGYDFVEMDTTANDMTGHGTHVSGIIVDSTPNLNVKILPVRVLDSKGEGYNLIIGLGIRYAAEKGAKIINLSVSGEHSSFIDGCVRYAVSKGCVVCVAAGNEGTKIKKKTACPGHMTGKGIITVGSVSATFQRSAFSNYGSSLDIMAPGELILSTWRNRDFEIASGTSMSVPYVSAAAAVYKLQYPSLGASGIKKCVLRSTVDMGKKGRDNYYGLGRLMMPGN